MLELIGDPNSTRIAAIFFAVLSGMSVISVAALPGVFI